MTVSLNLIPGSDLRIMWTHVAEWVQQVAQKSGIWTVQAMVTRIEKGDEQLWIVWDEDAECPLAALGSRLFIADNGRKFAEILWLTGRDLKKWRSLYDTFEKWAKHEGCYGVRHVARPGWERAGGVDFKKTHVLLERTL